MHYRNQNVPFMYVRPHSQTESTIGFSEIPCSVSEYSVLGGTTG